MISFTTEECKKIIKLSLPQSLELTHICISKTTISNTKSLL